jgi:protein-disulfide isomerase
MVIMFSALFSLFFLFPTLGKAQLGDAGIHFTVRPNSNPQILARFEGKEITVDALEAQALEAHVKRLELYQSQKSALEDFVRNQVIAQLAEKAKLSVADFLRRETQTATKRVTDKEVDRYLSTRFEDLKRIPPEAKERVKGLLHIQKLVAAHTKDSPVELNLARPHLTGLRLKTEQEPSFGPADAPVTIVEFSDFQCFYCARAKERVEELKKIYGRKIRFVFKNYPLPKNNEARPAAEASLCVLEQSNERFWKFHDLLFDNQKSWSAEDLGEYAKRAGADQKKYEECVASGRFTKQVDASLAEGRALGVSSTPSFFVSGSERTYLVRGAAPLTEFREVIDGVLK